MLYRKTPIYLLIIQLIIQRFNLMITNVQQIILFPVVCLLSISLKNEHMDTLLL